MSAITGIFYRDGSKVNPELIKKMNDILSHRGPDGSAIWCEGSVALGHQMLLTTQESLNEKLPLEEDGLTITADARIDNREELSEELDIEDNKYFSDSYFILKAYQKWGERCPEYLLGDFAFVIWDENDKKLFCARDHMGIKPFYYHLTDELFAFSTEIKSILTIPDSTFKLNEPQLAKYLLFEDSLEKEMTFYKDIHRLPEASSYVISQDMSQKKKYWRLDPNSSVIMNSDKDYANAFLEIFSEAVKCRLRSIDPVGVQLSGGLDSSSIICTASKIINDKNTEDLISFSKVYDNFPESDESYYINKVTYKTGTKSIFIKCDNMNPLDSIETYIDHDQPCVLAMGIVYKSYEIMKANDVRVCLSGEGGDDIVSFGTKYNEELLVSFQWKKLIKNIKYLSNVQDINPVILLISTFLNVFRHYIIKYFGFYFSNKKIKIRLNKDFSKSLKKEKFENKKLFNIKKFSINAREFHYFMLDFRLLTKFFETINQYEALFSIEGRYPFYDKRLIEFCYSVPTEMKLKFGFNRYIMRIAMEGILPEEVQWRKNKTDIGKPIYNKFLSEEIINRIINDEDNVIKDYVDLKWLQNKFKNRPDKSYPSILSLWRLTLFYLWKDKKNEKKIS